MCINIYIYIYIRFLRTPAPPPDPPAPLRLRYITPDWLILCYIFRKHNPTPHSCHFGAPNGHLEKGGKGHLENGHLAKGHLGKPSLFGVPAG